MNAWFKPKRYGYGAYPATWQGWALVVGYVVVLGLLIHLTVGFGRDGRTTGEYAFLLIGAALLVAALWIVSKRKTDGEWRWRWGDRN